MSGYTTEPFDWNDIYTGEADDVQEPDAQLLEIITGLDSGRALDVGCGAGGTVAALAQRGWQVTGVDIAPRAIEAARKVVAARGLEAELQVAHSARLELKQRYDLVLCSFALPTTREEQHTFYRLASQALTPGGTILIKDFDASMKRVEAFAPFHCPTVDELRDAFADLEIVRCELVETDRHGDEDDDDQPWTAALLQARRPGGA